MKIVIALIRPLYGLRDVFMGRQILTLHRWSKRMWILIHSTNEMSSYLGRSSDYELQRSCERPYMVVNNVMQWLSNKTLMDRGPDIPRITALLLIPS